MGTVAAMGYGNVVGDINGGGNGDSTKMRETMASFGRKNQKFFFPRANLLVSKPKTLGLMAKTLGLSLYRRLLNILSICTTKHNLNFDTFYLMKYP
jgi:hypothetical protein